MEMGADGYLIKPFSLDEFAQQLSSLPRS